MTAHPASVSLSEIVRIALPPGSEYAVGSAHRNRRVRWAVVVGVPLRREELMEQGDLVIVAVRSDTPDWETAIRQFIRDAIVAVVVNQPISAAAVQLAEAAELPVIALPGDSDLRAAYRSTLTLLLKREAQVAQRTTEISRQLFRLAAEDVSLPAIAEALASLTGHGVVVQDKRLHVIAAQPFGGVAAEAWASVLRRLADAEFLPEGWADRRVAAQGRGTVHQQPLFDGLARMVTPIVVKHLARGYLSVIGSSEELLESLDRVVVEQGAAAYAMAMSRAKAVSEATKQLRGDFIDAVLGGAIPSAELKRWASRLGHDFRAPHAAIIFAWGARGQRPSQRRLETLINGEIGLGRHTALVRGGDDEIAAFAVVEAQTSIQQARNLAEGVCEQAFTEYPEARLHCGIGRPVANVHEWPESNKEARQALAIARRLDARNPLYFGDLSVYRLLFQLEHHRELRQFCDETLGPLLDYDAKHNSNLVDTLSAYFDNRGNLTQTAEALFIHRNTLQYRMDRIGEIAGLDLDNAEIRLAMHLALKAYKLLQPPQ